MIDLALACALAHDPVVTATLATPPSHIRVGPPRAHDPNFAFEPGEVLCTARRADGMIVVIGLAEHGSHARDALAKLAAHFKGANFNADDGDPIPHLGDGSAKFSLGGIAVRHGSLLLHVAVFPGGKERAEVVEAEGVIMDDQAFSERIAGVLLRKLPARSM